MSLRAIWLGMLCVTSLVPCTSFAQLLDGPKAASADGFPAEWYVRDGEGLDELRALEGKPAQELSGDQWRGDSTTLAALKGKIVVLDFWATWCGPCMAVIPKNVEFVKQYKDKGVALIGVHDAKAGWDDVDQVISDKGINYPVVLDKSEGGSGATTKAYALKFWPTYFIIDRDGIVRGAAIKPDKVHDVVDRLLAESPSGSSNMVAAKAVATPDNWFLGGSKRLTSLKEKEGKRAAKLSIASWIGTELDPSDWKGQVRVIQFVRPEIAASIDQLTKVQAVSERFARQGVVFMAVCDARSNRDKMQSIAEDKRIELPIAFDKPATQANAPLGATAYALGIKFAPTTVVVDRAGNVRAAGLKPDFLDKVLNGLLAEPTPLTDASESDDETVEDKPVEDRPADSTNNSKTTEQPLIAERPAEGAPPMP